MQRSERLKQLMEIEARNQLTNTSDWYLHDVEEALKQIEAGVDMDELYNEVMWGDTLNHSVGQVIRYCYHHSNEQLKEMR